MMINFSIYVFIIYAVWDSARMILCGKPKRRSAACSQPVRTRKRRRQMTSASVQRKQYREVSRSRTARRVSRSSRRLIIVKTKPAPMEHRRRNAA